MLFCPIDFEESRLRIFSLTSIAVTAEKTIVSEVLYVKYSVGDLGLS